MNKHTPAPWDIEPVNSEYERRNFDRTISTRTANGNPVYVARAYNNIGTEVDANARLIAAAPDLLSSLEFARDCLTELSELVENGLFDAAEDWVVNNGAVWDTIRLCISKATGVTE